MDDLKELKASLESAIQEVEAVSSLIDDYEVKLTTLNQRCAALGLGQKPIESSKPTTESTPVTETITENSISDVDPPIPITNNRSQDDVWNSITRHFNISVGDNVLSRISNFYEKTEVTRRLTEYLKNEFNMELSTFDKDFLKNEKYVKNGLPVVGYSSE